jgi:hypothetical protein
MEQTVSPMQRETRRCTLADQTKSSRLLLMAVAGSIPFTAEEFDPAILANGGTPSGSERCDLNLRGRDD